MKESQLIKGCIKNDRRAQNALYEMYFPLMSSVALRYSKREGDALQKMNGGFLKVLQNISKYDHQFALATWIRNIMVNHMIDEFRKEKKYIASIHLTEFSETDSMVDFNSAESNLGVKELRSMLSNLPDVTEKVFNLYAIDGYKHREIADLLNISEGTSKWHVSDARKKLKRMLEKQTKMEEQMVTIGRK